MRLGDRNTILNMFRGHGALCEVIEEDEKSIRIEGSIPDLGYKRRLFSLRLFGDMDANRILNKILNVNTRHESFIEE